MLHAVFDTNVLVSTLIWRGKPRELWNRVIEGKVRLEISDELLSEFNEVILRPEFKKASHHFRGLSILEGSENSGCECVTF